jgi:aldehyde:ferredoxin oxidoreductase
MESNALGRFGWVGKVLRVDLSDAAIGVHSTSKLLDGMIGGRGLGQKILFDELDPHVNAFDPDNIVVLGAGPLVGTMAPASARMSVETKNPLTGGLCSSNFGGHMAPEMKYAGFDSVIIEGAAQDTSILVIQDGEGRIERTPKLRGLTSWETEEAIHDMLGSTEWRVAAIGPAGENCVRGACIIGERGRAGGRGGSGAVLGSKKLKAVAIRGTGSVSVAHGDLFMRKVAECWTKVDQSSQVARFREGGTHLVSGAGGSHGQRSQAVRNYQDEHWPWEKSQNIQEPVFRRKFEVRRLSCFNCPIYCSHFYHVTEGCYAGVACEGLQTNTVRAFGSNLDIDRPDAILAAQAATSQLGIDVDMAAASIAWAFELFERGILSSRDTEGLELQWGNHEAVITLLDQIAHRQGFGRLLADGVKRASEKLGRGSAQYAMHVKGADLNEQGMRWNKAWAFGIVTSSRGGGHLDGAPQTGFWGISPKDSMTRFNVPTAGEPLLYEENAPVVVWYENYKAAIDSLGMCYFTSYWEDLELLGPEDYAELFSLATGLDMTSDDLQFAGRRIQNVAKAFNTLHAGFDRDDDFPPRRLMEEPARTGAFKGEVINPKQWERMLNAYYQVHGWDGETGLQTGEVLGSINLQSVADKLDRFNMLK